MLKMAKSKSASKGRDFRKRVNETPDVDDVGEQTSEFETSSPSASPMNTPPVAKKAKRDTDDKGNNKPRFRWTDELIDSLLSCLNEQKTMFEFKGKDFEADLVKLYGNVRKRLAELHPNEGFGPVSLADIAEGLNTKELAQAKLLGEEESKAIKTGYERVKVKAKEIRQNYRKAVSEGTGKRSGSGKIVFDHWDTLKSLWGGSPATVCLENAVSSLDTENESGANPQLEWEYSAPNSQEDDEVLSEGVCDVPNQAAQPGSTSSADGADLVSTENEERKDAPNPVNPTPKFVDNKRKNMEKHLSANQRDSIYMRIAKDDLILKQNMVEQLATATAESNKAFEKLSTSIDNVGKSIGDGLKFLALAIGGNSNQTPHDSRTYDPRTPDPRSPAPHHTPDPRTQGYYSQQQFPMHNNGQMYSNGYHLNAASYPPANQETNTDKIYESL